jgi:hypothetical protein
MLTVKQPAGWGIPAQFELPPALPIGQYVFTASAGHPVIAIGTMQADCRAEDGWHVINVCSTGTAQAFQA